jgi:hypothetical protein
LQFHGGEQNLDFTSSAKRLLALPFAPTGLAPVAAGCKAMGTLETCALETALP